MRWGLRLLALVAPFVVTATADAGTYVVRACGTPAGVFPNRSWSYAASQHFGARGVCARHGDDVATEVYPNGAAIPAGRVGALTFTAPAGAWIADFRLDRSIYFYNPTTAAGPRSPYVLYELGVTPFAGAGDHPAREQVHAAAPSQWYGYPAQAADTGQGWVALKDFPALRGYRGGAGTLRIAAGCAPGGAACSLRSDGFITARIFGAEVTVEDPRRPVLSGAAFATDGATFTASDNAGIQVASVLDLTDPQAPTVVASRDYRAARSAAGEACDVARAAPCPTDLRDERLVGAVASGRRILALRVDDVGGNSAQSDPAVVQVGSPADSCSAGGTRVRARLPRRGRVRFGRGATIRGRVLAADGRTPIGGVSVEAYTRVARRRSGWLPARAATSTPAGRFRIRLARGPSRAVRIVLAEGAAVRCSRTLRLRVRAGITLAVADRALPRGGSARFSGRLRGGPARRGRLVIIQAFDGGRWRTFASARTGRGGRWAARYRFSSSASGTFRFRARARRQAGYPYATGTSPVRVVRVG